MLLHNGSIISMCFNCMSIPFFFNTKACFWCAFYLHNGNKISFSCSLAFTSVEHRISVFHFIWSDLKCTTPVCSVIFTLGDGPLVRSNHHEMWHSKHPSCSPLSHGLAGHVAIKYIVNVAQRCLQTLHKTGGILERLVGSHVEPHSTILDGITWITS